MSSFDSCWWIIEWGEQTDAGRVPEVELKRLEAVKRLEAAKKRLSKDNNEQ